jgi:hypothetical protein
MFLHDIKDIKNGRVITRDSVDTIVIQYTLEDIRNGKNPNQAFADALEDQNYYGSKSESQRQEMANYLRNKHNVNINMAIVNKLLGIKAEDSKTRDASEIAIKRKWDKLDMEQRAKAFHIPIYSKMLSYSRNNLSERDKGFILSNIGIPRSFGSKTRDNYRGLQKYEGQIIYKDDSTNKYFTLGFELGAKRFNSIEEVKKAIDKKLSEDSKTKDDQIAELKSQKEEARKQGYGTDAYEAKIEELQKDKY